jgi:hypothetical protein
MQPFNGATIKLIDGSLVNNIWHRGDKTKHRLQTCNNLQNQSAEDGHGWI